MFRFTIRDVLWLTVVVGLVLGWWMDQGRIRRQEAALRVEVQRLKAIPLTRAEAALQVAEAELASLIEVNQRNPSAVTEGEMRRLESQLKLRKLDVENARAREHYTSK